ncbi:MAG: glucokinase [Pseudonocardiales bacterium]|jgi:glucokinase|nr:glucokinase [Pseudonocardiales bacterium]
MPEVLAVDVGGTTIKVARADGAATLLDERATPTPVADGPAAVVAAIRAAVLDMATPAVAAACVVVPGVVDPVAGVARHATNLGWRDVPLRDLLMQELGVPVVVEHDVRAAGRAEQELGRLRDVRDGVLVVIGTGIAGVVLAGGEIVRGSTWLAGELGHLPVRPDGEPCACGQRGCTEVYASAAGIARRYLARTGRLLTARAIAGSIATDADAATVWDEAAAALGVALAAATLLLDPAVIVLGGGLSRAGEALRAPVAAALAGRLSPLAWRPAPEVTMSPLGARAGLLGAALLARDAVRGG